MTDDYINQTIKAYDTSPDKYTDATNEMINNIEIDKLITSLPNTTSPILDIGCAYGRDSNVFAKRGLETIGIDMSRELLKRAEAMHPDLTFQHMDVRKLDFPDNTFAGAWCNAVLLHLNDKDLHLALSEIYRVLQPGGIVAVSFKEGVGSKTINETFSSDLSRFYNFQTKATTANLFTEAGFKINENYTINERKRFGPDKRDLNWVWCFASKS